MNGIERADEGFPLCRCIELTCHPYEELWSCVNLGANGPCKSHTQPGNNRYCPYAIILAILFRHGPRGCCHTCARPQGLLVMTFDPARSNKVDLMLPEPPPRRVPHLCVKGDIEALGNGKGEPYERLTLQDAPQEIWPEFLSETDGASCQRSNPGFACESLNGERAESFRSTQPPMFSGSTTLCMGDPGPSLRNLRAMGRMNDRKTA